MGINPADFRKYVIRPTLTKLGTWSPSLENLLLGSAAAASQLGISLSCEHGFGVYKIAKETHHRVWDEFLAFDPDLASRVRGMASQRDFLSHPDMELTTNLIYSTAIAWGVYAHQKAAIPENENDTGALAECWNRHFKHDQSLDKTHYLTCIKNIKEKKQAVIAA